MHVVTEIDPNSGALFARNLYNTEFPDRTAFFDVDETTRTVTGDRTEFLGRNGSLRAPSSMWCGNTGRTPSARSMWKPPTRP
jgi:cellobiose phosphorylase